MTNNSGFGQYNMETEEQFAFSDCTEEEPFYPNSLDHILSSKASPEENGSNSESTSVDSGFGELNESSSNHLLVSSIRKLVVELIEFQVHLVVLFCILPIWLLHFSYTFLVDPSGIWVFTHKILFTSILKWVKEHKLILVKLGSKLGWGLLWGGYICFLLVILLVSALIITSVIIRILVTEPIQMKETLAFDYTKHTPAAYVPIEFKNDKHHKLQVTVSMTMPESDYNRNLGIFQIRLDFLSMDGEIVASSSLPCMLRFRSEHVRLLSSFLKAASIVAGYSSESQTIEVKFRNMQEIELGSIACLRVSMEQRAELQKGDGIPELYNSFVLLESEKIILWQWRKAIFICISMMIFAVEMMFSLLYCRHIAMPKLRT